VTAVQGSEEDKAAHHQQCAVRQEQQQQQQAGGVVYHVLHCLAAMIVKCIFGKCGIHSRVIVTVLLAVLVLLLWLRRRRPLTSSHAAVRCSCWCCHGFLRSYSS